MAGEDEPQAAYTTEGIHILSSPREAVRKRPGMYVGSPDDGQGALQMLLEVVANAVDQALAGRCTRVEVRIDADDTVTVSDDGPGIPADALADILERFSQQATVDGHAPHVHLGIGGVGLVATNALSESFAVDTRCAGQQTRARYVAGERSGPFEVLPTQLATGTQVRFRPDPRVLSCTRVPRVELTRRLDDLAFLVPAMSLSWTIAGDRSSAAGLVGRVQIEVGEPLGGVAHHHGDYATPEGPITVEVALAWRTRGFSGPSRIHGFANLQRTEDGKHVEGLLAGVRAFIPGDRRTRGEEGLVAAVAVVLADVHWGSPTRNLLITPAVRPAVKQATLAALQAWAERYPEAATAVRARGEG